MDSDCRRQAVNIVHTNVTAYPVSRYSVLEWIKLQLTKSDVRKVEDLCSGAVYCQLMEKLFGQGIIPMKRVKFNTQIECEFIQNFKLLQVAFNKLGVDRAIPIEKLTKGRYQDNYDFIQWFRMFYDANEPFGDHRLDVPKAKNAFASFDNDMRHVPTKIYKPSGSVPCPLPCPLPCPVPCRRPKNGLTDSIVNDMEPVNTVVAVHSKKLTFDELHGEVNRTMKTIDVIWRELNFYKAKVNEISELIDLEVKKPASERLHVIHHIERILKECNMPELGGRNSILHSLKVRSETSYPRTNYVYKKSVLERLDEVDEESESDGVGTVAVEGDSIRENVTKDDELTGNDIKIPDPRCGISPTPGIGDTDSIDGVTPI